MARGLKFWIKKYTCSFSVTIKGADQLRSNRTTDLSLYFRMCKKVDILTMRLILRRLACGHDRGMNLSVYRCQEGQCGFFVCKIFSSPDPKAHRMIGWSGVCLSICLSVCEHLWTWISLERIGPSRSNFIGCGKMEKLTDRRGVSNTHPQHMILWRTGGNYGKNLVYSGVTVMASWVRRCSRDEIRLATGELAALVRLIKSNRFILGKKWCPLFFGCYGSIMMLIFFIFI